MGYYDEPEPFWDGRDDEEPEFPEWYEADAYMPYELARIWADAPVIAPLELITTQVYQLHITEEEAA